MPVSSASSRLAAASSDSYMINKAPRQRPHPIKGGLAALHQQGVQPVLTQGEYYNIDGQGGLG